MTSQLQPRQPFAVLDDSRLQSLTSQKNRQNNIFSPNSLKSQSLKVPASAPQKRRLPSDLLADEVDSENVDPNVALSSTKRSKKMDGTPTKMSKFVLDVNKTAPSKLKLSAQTTFCSSLPASIMSTPTIDLRGCLPQNRRVSLLSSNRRIKTPFRRIDPLNKPSSALPFSIDAALSGTISSYTPPAPSVSAPEVEATPVAPVLSKKPAKSMPNTWFFDIHEDTPDQEAINLMEHSAVVLDISSDDDASSSRAKDAQERGKENVPPPEWTGPTRSRRSAPRTAHKGIKCPQKVAQYAAMEGPDAMLEDRSALREMDVTAFFVEEEEEKIIETPEVQLEADASSTNEPITPTTPVEPTPEVLAPQEPFSIREDTPEAEVAVV